MPNAVEGQHVADHLGVTKHIPEIPSFMAGEIYAAPGKTLDGDIEDIKRFPHVLQEGEDVAVTEKIHGTLCQMG